MVVVSGSREQQGLRVVAADLAQAALWFPDYAPGHGPDVSRAATVILLSAGGLALLAAGAAAGEPGRLAPAAVSASSWLAVGYLLLIDSLAGFALYNWLLRATTVTLASSYAYAVPVIAYLVGVLTLGEPFHPVILAGAAAIVIAVAAEVRAISTGR